MTAKIGKTHSHYVMQIIDFLREFGEGGIRTHGTLIRRTADFESAPLWPLRYLSVPEKTS